MGTTLLLFDLDGTLLHATNAVGAFSEAMREVFGVSFEPGEVRTDGMTDQAIVTEVLCRLGTGRVATAAEIERLEEVHGRSLRAAIAAGSITVSPEKGVREILEALEASPQHRLAVVTGNFALAASIKLQAAGLARYFAVGAYGSDHVERAAIADLGRKRAERHWGERIPPESCVVVGDTPRDLAAARANGMRAMLVATGRTSYSALADLGADMVFPDWTDMESILRALGAR